MATLISRSPLSLLYITKVCSTALKVPLSAHCTPYQHSECLRCWSRWKGKSNWSKPHSIVHYPSPKPFPPLQQHWTRAHVSCLLDSLNIFILAIFSGSSCAGLYTWCGNYQQAEKEVAFWYWYAKVDIRCWTPCAPSASSSSSSPSSQFLSSSLSYMIMMGANMMEPIQTVNQFFIHLSSNDTCLKGARLVWSFKVKTLSVGVQIKSAFKKIGWWPAGDKSFWGQRQPCSPPCIPWTIVQCFNNHILIYILLINHTWPRLLPPGSPVGRHVLWHLKYWFKHKTSQWVRCRNLFCRTNDMRRECHNVLEHSALILSHILTTFDTLKPKKFLNWW